MEVKAKSSKDDENIEDMALQIANKFCSRIGRVKTPNCGIVYCTSIKNCEMVAEKLDSHLHDLLGASQGNKPRVKYFHARLAPDVKEATQNEWSSGELPIVVATIAFGMGELIQSLDSSFPDFCTLAKFPVP